MCRTERLSVSEDFNAMTVDKWQSQPLQVSAGDIQNFIATDNVVRYLNETNDKPHQQLHAPIEFCKSAPFPLSFLDDYKLKQQLRARSDEARMCGNRLQANRLSVDRPPKSGSVRIGFVTATVLRRMRS